MDLEIISEYLQIQTCVFTVTQLFIKEVQFSIKNNMK
jgi:hypothetical protein